ncbi:MAG: DUF1553 domain-containing protein [Rhodothermaceae bacterium]|nr:DUF1553 domain-containing protein [Rhodothermaceae bacterium]
MTSRSSPNVHFLLVAVLLLLISGCDRQSPDSSLPAIVEYNAHIRPILSDKCFTCHGPDEAKREADLRLDVRDDALAELPESPGLYAIRPGKAAKSEVIHRITHSDPDEVMPPLESTLSLSVTEKALIRRWIEQGAKYEPLWSFVPVKDVAPPRARGRRSINNEIDRFVHKRVTEEGLQMAGPASKETLIRRAAFDLTGLPPTLEEIDAFLEDTSPKAFERVIDYYLESPAYGERMAAQWMDIARYADSDGYLDDKHREMSAWRDWVIGALNENMPYDEFVSWQLAGDLYPDPTQDHILATAFNRLHKKNSEAGIVFEEFRSEYVADRTNTFGKAFLGMTMECARCHDHKYDPISQKEYYQLYAFFNSTNDIGHAVYGPDQTPGPALLLATEEEEREIDRLKVEIQQSEDKLANRRSEAKGDYVSWVAAPLQIEDVREAIEAARVAYYPFDVFGDLVGSQNVSLQKGNGGPSARINDLIIAPGVSGKAIELSDYNSAVLGKDVGWYDRTDPFTLDFYVYPDTLYEDAMLFTHSEEWRLGLRGYNMHLEDNQVVFRMAHSYPQNAIEVRGTTTLSEREWTRITVTYDGSSKARGVALYLNGQPESASIELDHLYKGILFTPDIHTYGFKGIQFGHRDKFTPFKKGRIDEFSVFDRALVPMEVQYLHNPASFDGPTLTAEEADLLEYYLAHHDEAYLSLHRTFKDSSDSLNVLLNSIEEIMVMGDQPEPRPTHVLERGMYDSPGEEVAPGTPASILAFPEDLPRNRKGLADWLFHPDNPLAARVAVNRIWKMHFGNALVSTVDDFGNQGAIPTHPTLLDWLANAFRESGWDVKALHKVIMMSATYQQDSAITPELLEKDPGNRLLARGGSFRLPAEMIRDNALAISGLLVDKIGGPSVYPYQPEGLWDELSTKGWRYPYLQEPGEGLYRRSLYTIWKRTSPPPSMLIFDAPDRSTCTVDRQNSSTPLQALVLLNDPQYVEAARKLAERTLLESSALEDNVLVSLFRRITGRYPLDEELVLLEEFYNSEQQTFSAQPDAATAFLTNGSSPNDGTLAPFELAALSVVANALMNTDEGYTRR